MFKKRILAFVLLAILLASCGPLDTGTQPQGDGQPADQTPDIPPTPTNTPEPELSALDWLIQSEFIAYAQEIPNIIPDDLPEGFNAYEPDRLSAETPSGGTITGFDVRFERPVGGQVHTEDNVAVQLYAYDVVEGRTDHLERIAAEGYEWDFTELDGYRIARYNSSLDGRVWISGPYLIVIYTGLDTSEVGPWVDTFTSLFLAMFPPQ